MHSVTCALLGGVPAGSPRLETRIPPFARPNSLIRDNGSVLIEHLLAIALLGVLVVSVFSVLGTGALAAQMAQRSGLAGVLAAQKLEEIAADCNGPAEIARGPVDAKQFPGYERQAEVKEIASRLCQATVTVWWPIRGRERSLSLVTLVRRQEEP